jgi:predicted permease
MGNVNWFQNLIQDLRYGVRSLAKSPGYAATVVLTLAIGICANTTVFTWIRSVLANPLPGVPRGDRMVTLETLTPSGEMIDSSYADYRDFRDQSKLLSGVFAFKERPLSMGAGRDTEMMWSLMVSGNYFDVLSVRPAAGRFFTPEEQSEVPGAQPVVILGHHFWQRQFGGSPAAIGQKVRLNKHEFTVIGVAPLAFSGTIGGLRFDLYVPIMMTAQLTNSSDRWSEDRGWRGLYLMARLRDGVTLEQARAEIRSIAGSLARQYPEDSKDHSATLLRVPDATRGAQSVLGTPLRILMAVAGVVLLIVCANVANLQLARGTGRRKEIGVRHALGASRARVGVMLLTESLALAVAGGILGVLFSLWTVDFLRLLFPAQYLPLYLSLQTDWAVVLFGVFLCLLTGVVAGLVPMLQSGRNLHAALLSSGRSPGAVAGSNRVRSTLVVWEIALAMVALVCAGMLYRSFENAKRAHPGFEPNGVLIGGLNLSAGGYDREQGLAYMDRLRERVLALPGVEGVAYAEDVPLGFDGGSWEDIAVGGYVPGPGENMKIYRNLVTPGYLNLMRIRLLAGRDFTPHDDAQAPLVVIINESFAKRFFAGRDPLNRKVRGWGQELTVVGLAADSKYASLREGSKPYMYVPMAQFFRASTGVALQVRATGDVRSLIPAVSGEIRAIDPVPLSLLISLVEYVSAAYVAEKTATLLLSALGFVALVLAVLGLFSVMAYSVAQRTSEIGIRMALGAEPLTILRMVIAQGMRLALVGVTVGLGGAVAAGQMLGGVLYGVSPVDAPSLFGAGFLLTGVALLACAVPARRAANVDPMVALRYE